jgi:lysyl-tRNA synthetase class II
MKTAPAFLLRVSLLLAVSLGVASPLLAPVSVHAAQRTRTTRANKKKPIVAAPAKKSSEEKKLDKEANAKEIDASIASATKVDALDLLQQPSKYLKQKVTFSGTFNRFADTALDYKKAFRDSRDFVTFFILRPDVGEKTIPMSEMKLFFPRKKSDEVMDLEPGDKIQLVGTPFSTALDEPWLDIEHIKMLQKTVKPERKHTPEF